MFKDYILYTTLVLEVCSYWPLLTLSETYTQNMTYMVRKKADKMELIIGIPSIIQYNVQRDDWQNSTGKVVTSTCIFNLVRTIQSRLLQWLRQILGFDEDRILQSTRGKMPEWLPERGRHHDGCTTHGLMTHWKGAEDVGCGKKKWRLRVQANGAQWHKSDNSIQCLRVLWMHSHSQSSEYDVVLMRSQGGQRQHGGVDSEVCFKSLTTWCHHNTTQCCVYKTHPKILL